jgi:hypothetical protein
MSNRGRKKSTNPNDDAPDKKLVPSNLGDEFYEVFKDLDLSETYLRPILPASSKLVPGQPDAKVLKIVLEGASDEDLSDLFRKLRPLAPQLGNLRYFRSFQLASYFRGGEMSYFPSAPLSIERLLKDYASAVLQWYFANPEISSPSHQDKNPTNSDDAPDPRLVIPNLGDDLNAVFKDLELAETDLKSILPASARLVPGQPNSQVLKVVLEAASDNDLEDFFRKIYSVRHKLGNLCKFTGIQVVSYFRGVEISSFPDEPMSIARLVRER